MAENNKNLSESSTPKKNALLNWVGKNVWKIYNILVMALALASYWSIDHLFKNAGGWSVAVGVVVFSTVQAVTIYNAWTQVPENVEYTIQVFGKYTRTWKAGLHFLFPYFKLMEISAEVYMGEQMLRPYKDKNELVDFSDGSAAIEAFVYYIIIDSYKAVYNIGDVLKALEEQTDSVIRSYLSRLSIDVANRSKSLIDFVALFNSIYPDKESGKVEKGTLTWEETYEKSEALQYIRNSWGIDIKKVVISDIALSDEVIKARTKILEAEALLEASKKQAETKVVIAEGEKKARVIKAHGEKESLELEGAGMAAKIRSISQGGMSGREAGHLVRDLRKWEAVETKDVALIIDSGSGGYASAGAAFGAGRDTFDRTRNRNRPQIEMKQGGKKDVQKNP